MPSDNKKTELRFSAAESEKLRDMAQLYDAVKAIILSGEEIAPHNVTLPQILKELRDAFDHIMRIVAAKTGLKKATNVKYIDINLDKSFSHVYRCAYDALDWVSIILRRKIQIVLRRYSTSAISAAMPDYYSTIRPKIESTIPQKIAQIRGMKDIGAVETSSIAEYAECVEELKSYWDIIINAVPSLEDYSKRETRAKVISYVFAFLIGAAVAALGFGLAQAFG